MHFEIVPRSSLTKQKACGPMAGPPSVRYDKSGRLSFSKRASEAFHPYKLFIVGYDEAARALCFTAVEKPPEGLDENACYPIRWIIGKNVATHCALSCRRLLQRVGFNGPESTEFPILKITPETHSIILAIPAAVKSADESAGADRSAARVNGGEHAAA